MHRVLVVEDDSAQQYLIDFMLNRAGYTSVAVGSGEEALDLLTDDQNFDIILTDVRMPGMDGVDFLAILSEVYPAIPVIVMSVHTGPDWEAESYQHGAAAVLPKPFFGPDLIGKIEAVLRKQTQIP